MKIIKFFCAGILVFCLLFTCFIGKNKIVEQKLTVTNEQYKGIISLWQIDSFEGGSGSRKQFLLSVAREFEKTNTGVYVMVTNHTKVSAEQAISEGNYPDIISFGNGVNVTTLSQLTVSSKDTFKGGNVGDKSYAVAWCRGGYTIISNPTLVQDGEKNKILNNAVISTSEYTQPMLALALEGYSAQNFTVKKPMDAYVQFVEGKTAYLVGTQRDIVRLTNRGFTFESVALTKYNDLYQYVAIMSSDQQIKRISEQFIKYLTSEKVQSSLNKIDMMSNVFQVENDKSSLNKMQEIKNFSTISIFTTCEKLKEIQSDSYLAIKGDESALNKISKVII